MTTLRLNFECTTSGRVDAERSAENPTDVWKSSGCGFLDILVWCERARLAVKKETILANVAKCYMTSEPGPKFDVEPKPEAMEVEEKSKEQKEKKQIVVVKNKTPAEFKRLALKKERKKKRMEREKRKKEQKKAPKRKRKATPKRKRKATPKRKRKPVKKSPKRRVRRVKSLKKKKR